MRAEERFPFAEECLRGKGKHLVLCALTLSLFPASVPGQSGIFIQYVNSEWSMNFANQAGKTNSLCLRGQLSDVEMPWPS